ncbi:MAG TPA: hypothetical protein VNT54_07010, partial [Solirubrobacteraceae bacterium]|nr:hypothetical protein [Solirubrobacteraceae bacterium]
MLPAIPDPRGLGPTATVRLAAAAAVLLAAAVPAPASAAGWSSAQTLSSPATFIDGTGVAFGPRGDALATWTFTNGIGAGAVSGARAARRTAGAGFGPERPFATGLVR